MANCYNILGLFSSCVRSAHCILTLYYVTLFGKIPSPTASIYVREGGIVQITPPPILFFVNHRCCFLGHKSNVYPHVTFSFHLTHCFRMKVIDANSKMFANEYLSVFFYFSPYTLKICTREGFFFSIAAFTFPIRMENLRMRKFLLLDHSAPNPRICWPLSSLGSLYSRCLFL